MVLQFNIREVFWRKSESGLNENGYPIVIELMLSNGNSNKCKVVYGEVA